MFFYSGVNLCKLAFLANILYLHNMSWDRINDLLNQVKDLAKGEFALRASGREHLRALGVEVRQAMQLAAAQAANPDPDIFPKVAPEFYKDRADRNEGPYEFIKRVYGPWLGRDDVCQTDVFNLDEQGGVNASSKSVLETACYNLPNPRQALDSIGLQTKIKKIDKQLAKVGDGLKKPSVNADLLTSIELTTTRLWNTQRKRRQKAASSKKAAPSVGKP